MGAPRLQHEDRWLSYEAVGYIPYKVTFSNVSETKEDMTSRTLAFASRTATSKK